jgi:hypothetical protein
VKYRLFLIFFLFGFYPVGSNPISFKDVTECCFFRAGVTRVKYLQFPTIGE